MKKAESKTGGLTLKIVVLLIIGFLVEFFIRERYNVILSYSIIIALVSIGMFYYFWRYGFFNFLLVFLVSVGFFISLDVSFNFGLLTVFLISFLISIIFGLVYNKSESRHNYALFLLIAFVLIWVVLSFNTKYPDDWILENYLTVPFVVLLIIVSRWFKLSKTSYSLIFTFMFLHIVGAHYTYSEVPFGYWLQHFFNLDRNQYDRIVHFSFGFLLAYPVREVFVRIGNYKGIWALFAPIIFVFGLSSIYELIEWGAAVKFGGDLGIAYLGTQGDIWDAQKDMFVAGVGSIIAMFVTFSTIMSFRAKEYWVELKGSFKVRRGELGEVAIDKMKRK